MSTTTSQHDLYSTLGISKSTILSDKDLRTAYKRALLLHHPDKHGVRQAQSEISVDQISLAYKILSDSKLKAEYEAAVKATHDELPNKFRIFHTGLETFDLDELRFDEDSTLWSKECRCGTDGGFVITETELEANVGDGEIIAGCHGCSLWIRVLFSVAG